MSKFQVRQGDVWVESVDSIPESAEPIPATEPVILAYGERTGHAHRLNPADRNRVHAFRAGRDLYLEVLEAKGRTGKSVRVSHEEHAAFDLPPGKYVSWIQCEYEPGEIRNVAD